MRVAGVQMRSTVGDRTGNLKRAGAFVKDAAQRGAQLVLLPELMPSGYTLTPAIWAAAEPSDGPTAQWLAATSTRLGVYVGTSFVERDGRHVRNTFVLAGPDGEAGRVRKTYAETYFFSGQRGPHVIDCALGRIGIGICADNQYSRMARLFAAAELDLLLMPHAGPTAAVTGGRISEDDIRVQRELLAMLAPRYARLLGVPAVFVNQCGPMGPRRGTGLIGRVMESGAFALPGLSRIADADGGVLDALDADEGIVVADVGPARRPAEPPVFRGRTVFQRPWPVRALMAIDGVAGRAYYAVHPHRTVQPVPESGSPVDRQGRRRCRAPRR
jgi:N-carbamoylputrescine amidase